jgi:Protein of unknown function (DUF1656)
MTHPFSDVAIAGVLVAPFAAYAVIALIIFLVLRPLLHRLRLAEMFSHPSVAGLSLYVMILGLVTLLL